MEGVCGHLLLGGDSAFHLRPILIVDCESYNTQDSTSLMSFQGHVVVSQASDEDRTMCVTWRFFFTCDVA